LKAQLQPGVTVWPSGSAIMTKSSAVFPNGHSGLHCSKRRLEDFGVIAAGRRPFQQIKRLLEVAASIVSTRNDHRVQDGHLWFTAWGGRVL